MQGRRATVTCAKLTVHCQVSATFGSFLAPKTFSHPLLLTDDFKFIQAQDRYRPPEYINEFHSVLLVISDYSKCLKVNLRQCWEGYF